MDGWAALLHCNYTSYIYIGYLSKFLKKNRPPLTRKILFIFTACPTNCRCSNQTDVGLLVDCRGSRSTFPDNIPDAANVIDMSENYKIKFESSNFENCSNVKSLNLRLDAIQVVPPDMFQSMLKIEAIALDENSLQYNNLSFPHNPFQNLTRLKSVSLQSWSGLRTDLNEFGRMLDMLPSTLEELNINIPGVVGVAEMMKNSKNLENSVYTNHIVRIWKYILTHSPHYDEYQLKS